MAKKVVQFADKIFQRTNIWATLGIEEAHAESNFIITQTLCNQ